MSRGFRRIRLGHGAVFAADWGYAQLMDLGFVDRSEDFGWTRQDACGDLHWHVSV